MDRAATSTVGKGWNGGNASTFTFMQVNGIIGRGGGLSTLPPVPAGDEFHGFASLRIRDAHSSLVHQQLQRRLEVGPVRARDGATNLRFRQGAVGAAEFA